MDKRPLLHILFFFTLLLAFLQVQKSAAQTQIPDVEGSSIPKTKEKSSDPFDVTITGDLGLELPLAKVPPQVNLPFQDVTGLTQEGQKELILNEVLHPLSAAEKLQHARWSSRQVASPLMVEIPQAPFIRFEPPDVTPYFWVLRIVDQNAKTIKNVKGADFPKSFIEWDGFVDGQFKIRVGVAYTPIVFVTDKEGQTNRFDGEPVHYDVLQYTLKEKLIIEFSNLRLFELETADFTREFKPLLEKAIHNLRKNAVETLQVVVYAASGENVLGQKRLKTWEDFLKKHLVLPPESLTFSVLEPENRGDISSINARVNLKNVSSSSD